MNTSNYSLIGGMGLLLAGALVWITFADPVEGLLWAVALGTLGSGLLGLGLNLKEIQIGPGRSLADGLVILGVIWFVVISNPTENASELKSTIGAGGLLIIAGVSPLLSGIFLLANHLKISPPTGRDQ